jgi:hypothetical protein
MVSTRWAILQMMAFAGHRCRREAPRMDAADAAKLGIADSGTLEVS